LALAATVASAREVEERLFREHFRHAWVIAAMPKDETTPGLLVAVDEDQRIVGADRAARAEFHLDDKSLAAGAPLSALFEFSAYLFRKRGGQDVPVFLTRTSAHDSWRALLTPPLARTSLSRNAQEAMVHSRPRLSMLSSMPMPEASDLSRGGLAPVLKNRICEFIENTSARKSAWMPCLRWRGFLQTTLRVLSNSRSACHLTGIYCGGGWSMWGRCCVTRSCRCRKLRWRLVSRTRATWRAISGD